MPAEEITLIQIPQVRSYLQGLAVRIMTVFSRFSVEGRAGLYGITLIVIMAASAPILSVHPPDKITGGALEAPSVDHLLGTDELGMDIWSQICYGARMSLSIGIAVACIAGFGGGILGILAGYLGGLVDHAVMRTVDILMALPTFPLLVVLSAFLGPSTLNVIIILALFSWAKPARIARSQTLSIKNNTYITAARIYGATPLYLLRRHILPEVFPILFVLIISITSHAIMAETGLAFLGLGDPTAKTWGMMLYYSTNFKSIYFTPYWQWWLVPPLVALILLLLCLAFIGRDLERVLDPRMRHKRGK